MTNSLERAVIEAARSHVKALESGQGPTGQRALVDAVCALQVHERAQEPAVKAIAWHEVTEGDQLRSAKNGRFYPVLKTLRVRGGKFEITIDLAGTSKAIVRPTAEEPDATVRRGLAGSAVDVFVNVFSSGGN